MALQARGSIASRPTPAPTSACCYYHVGNKEDLYLAVLEGAYEQVSVPRSAGSISNTSIRPRRSSG